MRIAFIRRAHASTGGAELYLERLLAALHAEGHDVHLFTEKWPETAEATVHLLPVRGGRSERPLLFAEACADTIQKSGPFDVVFSLERTFRQDIYRAGDGVHRVWIQQRAKYAPFWVRPFLDASAFHRMMIQLEGATFHEANTSRVIVNSAMVRAEILEHFLFPAERITLIRNGVDVDRFRNAVADRDRARSRFGLPADAYVLAFVGSGWERKGLKFALRAFSKFRDPKMRFIIAGKGRMKFPSGAVCPGPVREIEQVYAAADLFLFPPIYEPSANVCFEALASGIPVITTKYNGAGEILEPGITGHLISRPDAVDEMIDAIGYWKARGPVRIPLDTLPDLSMQRNVRETLEVVGSCR